MSFIIKTTDGCNAACVYCSASAKRQRARHLRLEVVEALFRSIREYCAHSGTPVSCRFTWHGGEPLLRSAKFYADVVRLQERWLTRNGIPLRNQVQSNLLALTPEKLVVLKDLLCFGSDEPGSIGTSYDPIPGYRVTSRGDYDARWSRSIELLDRESLRWGMIHVTHRESIERVDEVYGAISSRFRDHSVRFNPLYLEGRGRDEAVRKLIPSPAQWGAFLVRLHQLWESDGKRGSYHPLEEWDRFHSEGRDELSCESSGRCAATHLGVTTEGDVCCCGRCIDRGTEPYGRIGRDSLDEILSSSRRTRALNRAAILEMTTCKACPWWEYCHGGCMADSLMNYGDIYRPTSWCEGIRSYFEIVFGEPVERPPSVESSAYPQEMVE